MGAVLGRGQAARRLAAALGLPCVEDGAGFSWVLRYQDGRLVLDDLRAPRTGPVCARVPPRRPPGLSRRQPLLRALGRGARQVVDATAGLGGDACLLAWAGLEVLALERSPVVAALLADALENAPAGAPRPALLPGDARELLPALSPAPGVVYLDPMFPPRRRDSALARKAPRALRRVVGEDPDAGELLAVARRCATARVVVKRPPEAEPLAPPDIQYRGKLARYDVYLNAMGSDPIE